jgi:hypothetical protein
VELRYLYIGSSDTGPDVAAWLGLPGTRLRWRFRYFGADVAAIDPGYAPVLLIADHRPPGSVLPIFAVADLEEAKTRLLTGGWALETGPMKTPEGPACVMATPSGTTIAVLEVGRPDAMDAAYADASNSHRVLP